MTSVLITSNGATRTSRREFEASTKHARCVQRGVCYSNRRNRKCLSGGPQARVERHGYDSGIKTLIVLGQRRPNDAVTALICVCGKEAVRATSISVLVTASVSHRLCRVTVNNQEAHQVPPKCAN
jgi:hypothetical protein